MKRSIKFACLVIFFLSIAAAGFTAEKKPVTLKTAADFKLPDLNDKEFTLSEYKDKKGVLLFFWTTWCPFCREELKKLQTEHAGLEKNSIQLLTINEGEPKYKVESFLKSRNINLTVLLDEEGSAADAYSIFGVPTYVLINESGKIISSDNQFPKDGLKKLTSK